MSAAADPDAVALLTSDRVADLLRAAVDHGGGLLVSWRLDHVDSHPTRSTTATYSATVDWPFGRRQETFSASVGVDGSGADDRTVVFSDGSHDVAVWLYPNDPQLPGLARAVFPEDVARLVTAYELVGEAVQASQVSLEMVGYRPRRRAVVRATVTTSAGPVVLYVKAIREAAFEATRDRHQLLLAAGIPAPEVALATEDFLLVLRKLPGRSMAEVMFDPTPPCAAQTLIELLDALPAEVTELPGRPPWTDAVGHYAALVGSVVPFLQPRLEALVRAIQDGLSSNALTSSIVVVEPTHGDFHEGQLFLAGDRVSGLLDVDTIGPGRRVDDLACLLAHLSTVQRMNLGQAERVSRLIRTWTPVFDDRVDPVELRLRAAAVAISLATGPYRGQEPAWEHETEVIVAAAERLVRSAG